MEKKEKKGNIQRKAIASILLAGIIPGIFVVILIYLNNINALKNSIGTNFQEIARETADKIQIIMDREIYEAQSLALSPYIRAAVSKANKMHEGKNTTEIQRPFDRLQQKRPNLIQSSNLLLRKSLNDNLKDYLKEYQKNKAGEYGLILITDRKGIVIAYTNKITDYYEGGEKWWQATFNNGKGKVFISGIDYEGDTQNYSIAISAPILSHDTKIVIGALKMVYRVNDIFKTITDIKIGSTGHANLVTSDGTLVVCPIFPPKSHKINERLMRQISSNNKPSWGVAADDAHGGKNSIIGFAPVISTLQMGPDNFGGKAWYIFVRQIPDETYASMYALLWEVSLMGFAFIVVLIPLGFYAARKIVKPIRLLTEGVELIGQGKLDHRINIKTNDEIEQLAETFNQMADNLEKGGIEKENYLRHIKESEEQYKTLFDYAEDSMLMVDTGGRIVAVNKRQGEVIGYSRDALLGKGFSFILPNEKDRETSAGLFKKILEGKKPPTSEVEVLSYGGNLLVMEMDLTCIKRGDEMAFVLVHLRDVTIRKILEQEILLERNKLETIIESMGDGLDIVNKDFSIQFMNDKFLKLFGREAIGKKCYEVYMGGAVPCDECPVDKGIENPGALEVNTVHGQTLLITHSPFRNLDGTVSILEIFKDITERKKLESTIKELELYNTLFDYAEDSMLMVDTGGRIFAVNKRQTRVIGYTKDALLGKAFSFILPNEKDRKAFAELFEKVIEGEKPPTAEVEVLRNGQGLLTMEMDLTSIKRGDEMAFVLVHLRNITKRKELEQQLLRVERLNAISHFSSTIAHDLRNPIIGIRKRLEGLLSTINSSSSEDIQRILNDVISSSGLLLGMVNDVLDVYQNSYEELPLIVSAFPPVEAIEEAIHLLQTEADGKKVHINLHSKHRSITINGDKRRLQRVFINLLANAIKYSPVDSKVDITFNPVTEENADCILFRIEDEGPGIHPSEFSKIFEPLYRKERKREGKTGTGLGLYFCKVVVDAHGGNIWVENGAEKGAIFYIKIPAGERKDAN